jgi:hypothetical protein
MPGLRELFEDQKKYLKEERAIEKTLQDLADNEHDFNPEVFKRSMIIELIHYLSNIWSRPPLYTIPFSNSS